MRKGDSNLILGITVMCEVEMTSENDKFTRTLTRFIKLRSDSNDRLQLIDVFMIHLIPTLEPA